MFVVGTVDLSLVSSESVQISCCCAWLETQKANCACYNIRFNENVQCSYTAKQNIQQSSDEGLLIHHVGDIRHIDLLEALLMIQNNITSL